MFFKERRGEAHSQTQQENAREQLDAYMRERAEKHKKEALEYLVETGRTLTPEQAEQYLEKIIPIKEKILAYARDYLRESSTYRQVPSERRGIYYAGRGQDKVDFDKLVPKNIDRGDPQLWHFKRIVEPRYYHFLPRRSSGWSGWQADELTVELDEGKVSISAKFNSRWAEELGQYLNEADVAFLQQEYMHAKRDLEENIRDLLAYVHEHPGGLEDEWKLLAGERAENA